MRTHVSCSWCHEMTPLATGGRPTLCEACLHRADLPRSQCDCDRCVVSHQLDPGGRRPGSRYVG
jgi:hypothetical protein